LEVSSSGDTIFWFDNDENKTSTENNIFEKSASLEILSLQYRFLNYQEKNNIKELAKANALVEGSYSPYELVKSFGNIGQYDTIDNNVLSFLLSKFKPQPREKKGYPIRTTAITVTSDLQYELSVALGKILRGNELPDTTITKLKKYAMYNLDKPLDELFFGLASTTSFSKVPNEYVSEFRERLYTNRADYKRLLVETKIAFYQIIDSEINYQERVINQLKILWKNEREPEIKINLANLILELKKFKVFYQYNYL
jgi:hypothetical protein